jgi:hypothetical protein
MVAYHPERILNLTAPLLITIAIASLLVFEFGFSWRWAVPAGLFTAVRLQQRGFLPRSQLARRDSD